MLTPAVTLQIIEGLEDRYYNRIRYQYLLSYTAQYADCIMSHLCIMHIHYEGGGGGIRLKVGFQPLMDLNHRL